MRRVTVLTLVLAFWISSGAHAENYVEVFVDEVQQSFAEVDVDSIRKGDDGLVYYAQQTDIGYSSQAVDCQRRISYLIETTGWKNPGWKSKGAAIVPGSYGAEIADFVCARIR